jgi:hypothetical protein
MSRSTVLPCLTSDGAGKRGAPSREKPAHLLKDVLIDATVCLAPRAVAEVVGPRQLDNFS